MIISVECLLCNMIWKFDNIDIHFWSKTNLQQEFKFLFLLVIMNMFTLILVLLNPDILCLCKQCWSRSVGFWRSQLIWIYTVCHSVCEFISTIWIKIWLAVNLKRVWHVNLFSRTGVNTGLSNEIASVDRPQWKIGPANSGYSGCCLLVWMDAKWMTDGLIMITIDHHAPSDQER